MASNRYSSSKSLATVSGTNDTVFDKLIKANGIHNSSKSGFYNKFARFSYLDPYNLLTTTKEYIFITKPDLHIFDDKTGTVLSDELKNIPIWKDAFDRYRDVLKQLQYSVNDEYDPFVNILSNSVASNLDLPGISANEVETNENIYGTHMMYRRSSLTTDEHHDFSLEFQDTKYLEVYQWFKLYDEYCKLKDLGMVTPVSDTYTINRILYDQMAIYKFVVGEDGESLIYWAKIWGVYPKSVPRDSISDLESMNSGIKFSVNFHGIFVDDLDPTILSEFDQLVLKNNTVPSGTDILPLYDSEIHRISGEWASMPFVVTDNMTTTSLKYKLKWRR